MQSVNFFRCCQTILTVSIDAIGKIALFQQIFGKLAHAIKDSGIGFITTYLTIEMDLMHAHACYNIAHCVGTQMRHTSNKMGALRLMCVDWCVKMRHNCPAL